MLIRRTDPRQDDRWQRSVEEHPDASIFHTAGWLEALSRTYGYEPIVYSAETGGQLASGMPFCRIRSRLTGRRLVSLPFSDHCQPLVNSPEELRELLSAVKDDARKDNCRYIELRPLLTNRPQAAAVDAAGLIAGHDAFIHRLDLRRSLDEVLRGFHKDCIQRKITRSAREQLFYEEGRSEDLLRKFYGLLLLTRRRHQLPPQPLLWFRNLIDCLGERLKIRVASKERTPVASIITLSFRNVVTYKYGCSDPRFNALGGMVFLMWRTIEEAMSEKAVELDLGRSDHDTPGLITFKDHWGAARQQLIYYRHPPIVSRATGNRILMSSARRLFTAIPDSFLTALGGAIYRHVG